MSDKDVAEFFGISLYSLQRKMREGFGKDETDLRKAKPEIICRRRWWYRPRLMALVEGRLCG